MNDPWENRPTELEEQVERYVKRAAKVSVGADLIKKYARILIAAETVLAYREHSEHTTRDNMALLAASEHGISTDDLATARKCYAAARIAQQQVHASATGCSRRLTTLEKLLETHYDSLRHPVIDQFPIKEIATASRLIRDFASATALGPNLADITMTKSPLSHTAPGHAFVWWRRFVPEYKHKWIDMHALARCWRLTDAKGVGTFKRRVQKLKPEKDLQGVPYILRCPPWAL